MFVWPIDSEISLALWEEQDASTLAHLVRQDASYLGRWLPFASPAYDEVAALEYIRRTRREWAEYRGLELALWGAGELAGSVGMHGLDRQAGRAEIGYWLRESMQGRGWMTRAVSALVTYGFDRLGLNRLVIMAQPANARSRAIPERLGFRQEGVLRQDQRYPQGYVDHVVYALLRSEWTPASPPRAGV